jgi:hypothetical protein
LCGFREYDNAEAARPPSQVEYQLRSSDCPAPSHVDTTIARHCEDFSWTFGRDAFFVPMKPGYFPGRNQGCHYENGYPALLHVTLSICKLPDKLHPCPIVGFLT